MGGCYVQAFHLSTEAMPTQVHTIVENDASLDANVSEGISASKHVMLYTKAIHQSCHAMPYRAIPCHAKPCQTPGLVMLVNKLNALDSKPPVACYMDICVLLIVHRAPPCVDRR